MVVGILNFNIGVLGHVDSGKTSLCKALSTTASTAAFDKNPQSKERGITLDLGFSSFTVPINDEIKPKFPGFENVQYTLVDCPGHASLIRTIIGGAQIIDMMFLVIDVVKGMQTQTAECLVIGQITCETMLVILNKTDLIPPDKRQAAIDKMKKRMWKTLENTEFKGCPIVAVAAKPEGPEGGEAEADGVTELISELLKYTYLPKRSSEGPFIFSVDHCFSIRGQGTVLTGTCINGSIGIGDNIEMPAIKVQKKVKSIQMFHKPVEKIMQGDRAGICVTQLDPKLMERGLICVPGALVTAYALVASVHKINYFKGTVATKAKFHITVGHETVMGNVTFFGLFPSSKAMLVVSDNNNLDYSLEYSYQEELHPDNELSGKLPVKDTEAGGKDSEKENSPLKQFVLIVLEKPVTCAVRALMIGSKLDSDIHDNVCRLAFHGKILEAVADPKYKETFLPKLKVFKIKSREGQVERVTDAYTVIGKNLFKKETNIQAFVNLKVKLSSGQEGIIEGGFGQSGKVKLRIPGGLLPEIVQRFSSSKRKVKQSGESEEENVSKESPQEPVKIILSFKCYIYDPQKKMMQT